MVLVELTERQQLGVITATKGFGTSFDPRMSVKHEEIQTNEAKVVSIGKGVDLPISVGDTVFVRNRAGHELRDKDNNKVVSYDFFTLIAKKDGESLVALGNRVILKSEPPKETHGILLNHHTTAKPNTGIVVSKSSDCEATCDIGDTVAFDFFNVDNVNDYIVTVSENIKLIKKDNVFKPTNDFILVKVHDIGHKDQGGLLIPENSYSHSVRATIVAAGLGFVDKTTGITHLTHLSAGQDVIISPKAGVETVIDNVTYRIVQSREIMGLFE